MNYIIPEKIQKLIEGKSYEIDDIGKSDSEIMIFDDMVLKVQKFRAENDSSVEMMRWLEGKIPAPKVICYETDGRYQYLLMTRVKGMMACDRYYMDRPKELFELLAEALHMMWSVDISDCPCVRNLESDLKEAKFRIDNDLVDVSDAEPGTFGEGGMFKNPEELYQWLVDNQPDFEPVLSHGDFCLPNILFENGKISGFIDIGDSGAGDKWKDIALCYRSLKHNSDGKFGGAKYPDINPEELFEVLGIKPNWEKINYYILLDELF